MNKNPTQRFSDRVGNYTKYRPGYPAKILNLLKEKCNLTPGSIIADIGSGTGIFTKFLLDNGNSVVAVEPNPEMRAEAERILASNKLFSSITGEAEATTLDDHSVDIITSAQAFHWFDHEKAKQEFRRILIPKGWVVLVWNELKTGPSPFLQAYEDLLTTHSTDYGQVDHKLMDAKVVTKFYLPSAFNTAIFSNSQDFDLEALKGRLLSSSYAPNASHPNHKPMMAEIEQIFAAHNISGKVRFEYKTQVYYGRL